MVKCARVAQHAHVKQAGDADGRHKARQAQPNRLQSMLTAKCQAAADGTGHCDMQLMCRCECIVVACSRSGRTLPSWNSSNSTEKAPRKGAQDTSSIGRTVSPSTALKKVAPFAWSLHTRTGRMKRHAEAQMGSRCRLALPAQTSGCCRMCACQC